MSRTAFRLGRLMHCCDMRDADPQVSVDHRALLTTDSGGRPLTQGALDCAHCGARVWTGPPSTEPLGDYAWSAFHRQADRRRRDEKHGRKRAAAR